METVLYLELPAGADLQGRCALAGEDLEGRGADRCSASRNAQAARAGGDLKGRCALAGEDLKVAAHPDSGPGLMEYKFFYKHTDEIVIWNYYSF